MSGIKREEYGGDPMTFVDYLERFFRPYADRPRLREEVDEALQRVLREEKPPAGEVCYLDAACGGR